MCLCLRAFKMPSRPPGPLSGRANQAERWWKWWRTRGVAMVMSSRLLGVACSCPVMKRVGVTMCTTPAPVNNSLLSSLLSHTVAETQALDEVGKYLSLRCEHRLRSVGILEDPFSIVAVPQQCCKGYSFYIPELSVAVEKVFN
jgi:hypothetical protein